MRRPGLTKERHEEIGPELARIEDRLITLGVEIANAYPKNSRLSRFAIKMNNALGTVRCRLDDEYCSLCPPDDRECIYCYFPKNVEKRAL
jgi:hypothetical protein